MVARIIADNLKCPLLAAEDDPPLNGLDDIIIVLSNTGDEEMPQPMEDFLASMVVRGKRYVVCELGNYFGFENYSGCKKEVFKIAQALEWKLLSDVSIDSYPAVDEESLQRWIASVKNLFLH